MSRPSAPVQMTIGSVPLRESRSMPGGSPLDGTSVVICAPEELGARLTDGLRQLGAAVVVLETFGPTRERAIASLSSAREQLGGLDAVVCAPPLAGPADAPFAEMDEEDWARGAEAPIWESLVAFQAAYVVFGDAGGSLVAVVPTIAITGAAGFVACAAAAEGIRQLVKSAARAWGRGGTRVNCLAVPIEEWGVTPSRPVPNRYGASLPGANTSADLAGAAALLISPLSGAVTGTTVGLDRGTVLAP